MTFSRIRIQVTGQVQGVGFRPRVYQIANRLNLTGWVQNDAKGVMIEIQGLSANQFIPSLLQNLPTLAKIDSLNQEEIATQFKEGVFAILESKSGVIKTRISSDVTICQDCLIDLFDADSHYYLYPFLNCTNCGPRLTITRQLPYDRCQTSMADFVLCQQCQRDYHDPDNRRYHAQPIACCQCGPKLSKPIEYIAELIKQGEIVALKGLGGYQLICDATNEKVVSRLRKNKHRDLKPFALMMLNIESVQQIFPINKNYEIVLTSKERPIVLLPKKNDQLPYIIAPNLAEHGVMLPSTPLHYLLFHALLNKPTSHHWLHHINGIVLVVTSANIAGSPLIYDDDLAGKRLSSITKNIINYNRDIVTHLDDSVVRIINEKPIFIRRARGFVPNPIKLAHAIPSTLAVGGQLKNTFCLTRDDEAYVSQYIGSLNNRETIDYFHHTLNHFLSFLNIHPERIAHDCHPDFYTTHFAQNYGIPTYQVQHHHAHLAAVAAEHHLVEPMIGLVLDGYGYGNNGEAWGGEILFLDKTNFIHLASLQPIPQPGADKAVKEPWRMAASILYQLGWSNKIIDRFKQFSSAYMMVNLLQNAHYFSMTSSCGRLFDAASALLNINHISQYEGQAAMQLESLVTRPFVLKNGWCIDDRYLNFLPLFAYLIDLDPVTGANVFHGTLIAALTEWSVMWAKKMKVDHVVLSGGCFSNKILAEGLVQQLLKSGFKTYLPHHVPVNDGGLSLGQAWIAGNS